MKLNITHRIFNSWTFNLSTTCIKAPVIPKEYPQLIPSVMSWRCTGFVLPRSNWLMIPDPKFKSQGDDQMFASTTLGGATVSFQLVIICSTSGQTDLTTSLEWISIPCPSTIHELNNIHLLELLERERRFSIWPKVFLLLRHGGAVMIGRTTPIYLSRHFLLLLGQSREWRSWALTGHFGTVGTPR